MSPETAPDTAPSAEDVRVVVCLSGGIDSTVLLYDLRNRGHEVIGFGVDYGQRHRRELEAAKAICADLGIRYVTANVSAPFLGSELTDGRGGPVVPNRNMMLIALAGATAVSHDAQAVAIACHAGDYRLFPDCRPEFLDALAVALKSGSGVELLRPYVHSEKAQIVADGIELGVPFDLTWSCYHGGEQPCGSWRQKKRERWCLRNALRVTPLRTFLCRHRSPCLSSRRHRDALSRRSCSLTHVIDADRIAAAPYAGITPSVRRTFTACWARAAFSRNGQEYACPRPATTPIQLCAEHHQEIVGTT